jgi:predicted nucleic acid-binding protein
MKTQLSSVLPMSVFKMRKTTYSANRRGIDSALALSVLEQVSRIVASVDRSLYESYEQLARERIQRRDPDDWPVVAVALMLDLPVWTENQDFFGSGIPTWSTDRVELYLRGSAI